MRLFLVRHAVSEANLDKEINARYPDSKVNLAPEGHAQAASAGNFLAMHLKQSTPSFVRVFSSPYERTRQTAKHIMDKLQEAGLAGDYREEVALREMSFGLFDGIADDELATRFPLEQAHYQKHVDFEGEFYAPMPMGESRVQVADRVKGMFGTIKRDHAKGIEDFVIVSHGIALRAFIMQWMHFTPEWYEAEKNPANASISLIETNEHGSPRYKLSRIFDGFARHDSKQDKREEGKA